MNIFIDINHPADVHFFRNFIKLMEAEGHQFCITNRDTEVINRLLDYYGIAHIIRGKRGKKTGVSGILLGLAKTVAKFAKISRRFKPDLFMGFASASCALTSFVTRKPCILIDDTDHNIRNQVLYLPFCTKVLLPFYFHNKLFSTLWAKKKSERFNAYVEQMYLHSSVYSSSMAVLDELNLSHQNYVIIRFSAFDASHDAKVHHLTLEIKKQIVQHVSKRFRVILSLEEPIEDNFLNQYVVSFSPEKMHDLLASARLIITEGATMASEAFVLGVPYVYINPLVCGYIDYQCTHYGHRAFRSTDYQTIIKDIDYILSFEIDSTKERRMVEDTTINPTEYLVDYIHHLEH